MKLFGLSVGPVELATFSRKREKERGAKRKKEEKSSVYKNLFFP